MNTSVTQLGSPCSVQIWEEVEALLERNREWPRWAAWGPGLHREVASGKREVVGALVRAGIWGSGGPLLGLLPRDVLFVLAEVFLNELRP